MTVAEVFTDYAISGGHLSNRPGMLSLIDKAKDHDFDVVIAEALDRVSRDQEDVAAIYKRLNHADVRIVTPSEGEVNKLHVGLRGTMNALFLKDLTQKTRRGQRCRVEDGKIPGGNSYGYKIVRRILDDGSVSKGEREIDPDEAAVVKRIFEEYAAGVATRKIASRLNAEAVPSPRGGEWNASTINGSRQRRNGILNNELYLGRITHAFFILFASVKGSGLYLLIAVKGLLIAEALPRIWDPETQALFAAVMSFWLGNRTLSNLREWR